MRDRYKHRTKLARLCTELRSQSDSFDSKLARQKGQFPRHRRKKGKRNGGQRSRIKCEALSHRHLRGRCANTRIERIRHLGSRRKRYAASGGRFLLRIGSVISACVSLSGCNFIRRTKGPAPPQLRYGHATPLRSAGGRLS